MLSCGERAITNRPYTGRGKILGSGGAIFYKNKKEKIKKEKTKIKKKVVSTWFQVQQAYFRQVQAQQLSYSPPTIIKCGEMKK